MKHAGTAPRPERASRFTNPYWTADGDPRAHVDLRSLSTLWFNTGTLCNLACANCYIESTPRNDRLSYLKRADVGSYLREAKELDLPVTQIGITGGEPFMNPEILEILEDCLSTGVRVLVLTNAMRPMTRSADRLVELRERYEDALSLRVSLDHYDPKLHESERGERTWKPALQGLRWLSENGFKVEVAARKRWGDTEEALRQGFGVLFNEMNLRIDASSDTDLILFPEMDETHEVPEITAACWGALGVDPDEMMCATARMVVRRRDAPTAEVIACTLIPYDPAFSFGPTLAESLASTQLNHPHCARFCVLGGGHCAG